MPPPTVPLQEITTAVQSAVQQVLAKHGAVGVDHLWVGFVAPEAIANQQNAQLVATELGRAAGGAAVQASVAQLAASGAPGGAEKAVVPPKGHIIGLIYSPKLIK